MGASHKLCSHCTATAMCASQHRTARAPKRKAKRAPRFTPAIASGPRTSIVSGMVAQTPQLGVLVVAAAQCLHPDSVGAQQAKQLPSRTHRSPSGCGAISPSSLRSVSISAGPRRGCAQPAHGCSTYSANSRALVHRQPTASSNSLGSSPSTIGGGMRPRQELASFMRRPTLIVGRMSTVRIGCKHHTPQLSGTTHKLNTCHCSANQLCADLTPLTYFAGCKAIQHSEDFAELQSLFESAKGNSGVRSGTAPKVHPGSE